MSRARGLTFAAGRSAVALLVGGLLLCADPEPSAGWDVRCFDDRGEDCPDPFAEARTPWLEDEHAEHRALLLRTLQISGLPAELTGQFTLQVFAGDAKVVGPGAVEYDSVAPVLFGARRTQVRELSIPGMASLPDFSYTLWDWASGNEDCPPDPSNLNALDCHNYETHIGWLNSNHMLPQARKWYEHLHAIALEHARRCKREYEATPLALRERYEPYFMECERLALVAEGAAHHYLQDAWATGHMWERWGGTEPADFGGNRALGFLISSFVGLIHGAKALVDPLLRCLPGFGCDPFDDPMNAPHPRVAFIDGFGSRLLGVGDVFLPELNAARGAGAAGQFDLQRKALLGCAVSSIREVYSAGPQMRGELAAASTAEFDTSRNHRTDSCWAQRATDSAVAEGFGLHQGAAPTQRRLWDEMLVTLIAHLDVSPARDIILGIKPDLEILEVDEPTREAFTEDAGFLTTYILARQEEIGAATLDNRTTLASGGMGKIAGISTNRFYLRGDAEAKIPPAFYADPFPPWRVKGAADIERRRSRALALTFADSTVGERCEEVTADDLERWRIEVAEAREGGDADAVAASCGHCTRMVAPHLRHGREGSHDGRREAYCAAIGRGAAAFAYTDEDAASFTGTEPVSFEALRTAARGWCECDGEEALEIATTVLPEGTVGVGYGALLEARGGQAPYTWSVTGLPPGLFLVAGGASIEGLPTTAGSFPISLEVRSADDRTARSSATLLVKGTASGVGRVDHNAILDIILPSGPVGCPALRIDDFGSELTYDRSLSCAGESGETATAELSFTKSFAGSDLVGFALSGSATARRGGDFDQTAGSVQYILRFTASRSTQLTIDAAFNLATANSDGGVTLSRDGAFVLSTSGGAPVTQTLTLLPGRHQLIIYANLRLGETLPSPASAGVDLRLVFGP